MSVLIHTKYDFLPYLRRGLGAFVNSDPGREQKRAYVTVGLNITAEPSLVSQTDEGYPLSAKQIELLGPGDITGFDQKIVVRTEPKDNVGDFEPNYFPFIEFSDPGYPWRFTATAPDMTNARLTPWISLIVLLAEKVGDDKEPEILEEGQDTDKKIRWVKTRRGYLPDLKEAWRWAHTQITSQYSQEQNDQQVNKEALREIIRKCPERIVSRLLCARRLRAGAKYYAYVVPTFKLGASILFEEGETSASAINFAWGEEEEVRLPYYYRWEFRTGLQGDFEHLVRLLEPRDLTELGLKKVDCSNPGFGSLKNKLQWEKDDKKFSYLEFESALQAVETKFTPWGRDNDQLDSFQKKLANLLNQTEAYMERCDAEETPKIVAPVYGCWHSNSKKKLGERGDWLEHLNLDPRHRGAAAYGAEVIKKNQEDLMAAAWDQLGEVQEVNRILRNAQTGREISGISEHRLKWLADLDYFRITSPLLDRVKGKTPQKTVKCLLQEGRIGQAPLDQALQRIARKRGAIRKRQKRDIGLRGDMLARINQDNIKIAERTVPSSGVVSLTSINKRILAKQTPQVDIEPKDGSFAGDGEFSCALNLKTPIGRGKVAIDLRKIKIPPWMKLEKKQDAIYLLRGTPLSGKATVEKQGIKREEISLPITQNDVTVTTVIFSFLVGKPGRGHKDQQGKIYWQIADFKQVTHDSAKETVSFVEKNLTKDFVKKTLAQIPAEDKVNREIGGNIIELIEGGWLAQEKVPDSRPQIADLKELRQIVAMKVSVEKTIVDRTKLQFQVNFPEYIKPSKPGRELDTIMVAPEFVTPMYKDLAMISQVLLLRGIEKVPQNTLALLEQNQRFIEAYLCGINHEFSRELKWREYPAVLDGSFFRQFWDVSGNVITPRDKQAVLDCYYSKTKLKKAEEWDLKDKDKFIEIYEYLLDEEFTSFSTDQKLETILQILAEEEFFKDIDCLHKWKAKKLGGNTNKKYCSETPRNSNAEQQQKLVLLIRGDLLRKYPNTVIYAVKKAQFQDKDGNPIPDLPEFTGTEESGEIKEPIFRAVAEPDMTFLGFPLTEVQAMKEDWYFVLQERVSETRFGLDAPSGKELVCSDDLAWDHFGLADSYDSYLNGKNITSEKNELSTWGESSASIAKLTMQKPVRIIVSAEKMLPKKSLACIRKFNNAGGFDRCDVGSCCARNCDYLI